MKNKNFIVMKFGGTSVQDAVAIRNLYDIVKSRPGKKLVVVSALAKVTDQLLNAIRNSVEGNLESSNRIVEDLLTTHLQVAKDLGLDSKIEEKLKKYFEDLKVLCSALGVIGDASPRTKDSILSIGELCSSILVSGHFRNQNSICEWIDSRLYIKTDSTFGAATVDFSATNLTCMKNILAILEKNDVLVAQGFIASDAAGVTTTLGRGGSDYSASIYGSALDSDKIEIWTDVDGILTTDPRIVKSARKIKKISYQEAAELAFFGAKVLHPSTIAPAVLKNISVYVLNSKNPSNEGTEITGTRVKYNGVVKAIATKKGVTVINIYSAMMLGTAGFLRKVFEVVGRHNVSVDLIATSEVNISMTLDQPINEDLLNRVVGDLTELGQVSLLKNQAIVSVVGDGIRSQNGVCSDIFSFLKEINIVMISMGASEMNLSFVVDGKDAVTAVGILHSVFFDGLLPSEIFE